MRDLGETRNPRNVGKDVLRSAARNLRSPLVLWCWIAVAACATMAGPFSFGSLPSWPERALFWFPVIGISFVLAAAARALAVMLGPGSAGLGEEVLTVTLFTAGFTPLLWGIIAAFDPPPEARAGFGMLLVYVAALACAGALLRRLARSDVAPDEARLAPPLLARLDAPVRGEVLMLSARDHLVDVVTDRGREAVRMRLADAIAQLDGVEGMQVHRSHWVAAKAVAGSVRRDGRLFLTTRFGAEVPVGRKFRPEVEGAGLA